MYPAADAQAAPAAPPADPSSAEQPVQQNPMVTLQLSEDQISKWFKEIEASIARRKTRESIWDILLKEYMPTVSESGGPEALKMNGHFRNTHTKLAKLFHKLPELHLEPKGPLLDPVATNPLTGQVINAEDAAFVKQAVLNDKLGSDGVDASRFMDEILLDVLQWAGLGYARMGYRNVIKPVQKPVMVPGPATIDPVSGQEVPGQPVQAMDFNPETMQADKPRFETVPVPIWEEFFLRRGSPKKLLLPADLTSGRIDEDACWVGEEFFFTAKQLKQTFQYDTSTLPNKTGGTSDDRVATYDIDGGSASGPDSKTKFHGYQLWIKASEYDDAQPHPDAIHHLVLLDVDKTKPIVYRPSPDQTFDEEGKLTADSLIGFPLEVCYLRDLPDSPYPPADAAFTNSQVKFLNTHGQQSVALRDSARGRYLYDEGEFTPEEIERIKAGKVGEFLAVQPGKLANGSDKLIVPLIQARQSPDDVRTRNLVKQEMEETLGISANDTGVENEGGAKTATEVHDVSTKSAQRMGKDQQRAVQFYLRCVRKFDTFLIRYASNDEYVRVTGQDGMRRLMLWNNKIIGGRWAYDIKPDSQAMMDAARDRVQTLTYYEKTAADPLNNRLPVLKKLAGLNGLDPARATHDPAMVAAPGTPGAAPASSPQPGGAAPEPGGQSTDRRAHRETGQTPNSPQTGTAPNTPQVGR